METKHALKYAVFTLFAFAIMQVVSGTLYVDKRFCSTTYEQEYNPIDPGCGYQSWKESRTDEGLLQYEYFWNGSTYEYHGELFYSGEGDFSGRVLNCYDGNTYLNQYNYQREVVIICKGNCIACQTYRNLEEGDYSYDESYSYTYCQAYDYIPSLFWRSGSSGPNRLSCYGATYASSASWAGSPLPKGWYGFWEGVHVEEYPLHPKMLVNEGVRISEDESTSHSYCIDLHEYPLRSSAFPELTFSWNDPYYLVSGSGWLTNGTWNVRMVLDSDNLSI